jgi:beta-lactamase class D
VWPTADLINVTVTQYVLKSGWEVVATPATYWIVGFLKRAEREDYYDRNTDFTPFSLRA